MAASVSLESRLRALELKVFSASNESSAATPRRADVMARLEALERSLQLPSLTHQLWNEVEAMEQDLTPGTALTHQKQIMAPMLYRREQILAEQDTYLEDLERVGQILNLLLIDQDNQSSLLITEEQVVNAPIIVDTGLAADEVEKLERLAEQVVDLQRRVQKSAQRLDQVLESYTILVSAASEKLVLLEEDIRQREEAKTS
jgi:hypothetical protein